LRETSDCTLNFKPRTLNCSSESTNSRSGWGGRSHEIEARSTDRQQPSLSISETRVKEAELRRAFARASTVASEEVASALKSMEQAFLAFRVVLGQAEHGAAGALQLIKEARKAFDARVEETEAAIRGDVRR
jgi:hypothetical protein